MNVKTRFSEIIFTILPGTWLLLAFAYITFIIRPDFYFHHVQPPFLFSPDFLKGYLHFPGGLSELMSTFLLQSFHNRFSGPVILLLTAFMLYRLTVLLLNSVYKDQVNKILGLIPFSLSILLINNYNFPFPVFISLIFVLLFTLFLTKTRAEGPEKISVYFMGAVFIYYVSGSGFLILFNITAFLFILDLKSRKSILYLLVMPGISASIMLLASNYIFPLPSHEIFFYYFREKPYFLAYEPGPIYYLLLLSPVLLFLFSSVLKLIFKKINPDNYILTLNRTASLIFVAVIGISVAGHILTFSSDARKMVASDFFCYIGQPEKTARNATTMENYSFAANVNYNMAMSRAGILTDSFFNFFQVRGSYALQPDVEFASDMSFIAADYYYDLGFISEARHWAYESLVNFPFSPRAMELLVRVHLVTGEYEAAERYLNLLDKGLIERNFVRSYKPFVEDTSLIGSNSELTFRRSCIPADAELSPFTETRLQELLEANKANKTAYEYLMLCYLLDDRLDKFMESLKFAGDYFERMPPVYEEAILMHAEEHDTPIDPEYLISQSTLDRYEAFNRTKNQYENDPKLARNILYWEMGKTCMYYLKYVFPRIVLPEINLQNDEEPPI